jgi:hypothetical protein
MTRYQIEAPVRTFTGEVAGVAFKNGTGFVTDGTDADRAALAYFRRGGYGVSEAPEQSLEEMVTDLVTPPPASPSGSIAQTGGGFQGPFDPSEHTVAAVLSHLDGAGRAEAERVLDAEAAGQNRAGIVKQREALLAAKSPAPTPDETKTDPKGPTQ